MNSFCLCLLLALFSFLPLAEAEEYTNSASSSDRAFFEQIKKAILSEDTAWLSSAVDYPFTLNSDSGIFKLRDKKDFKKYAKLIFTDKLKSTLRKQSPDHLFKNWQGLMIGQGEIWFSEVGEKSHGDITWVYRVLALNLKTSY